MPIFRQNHRNIYFVHVPKCGGTSIEQTLISNGIDLCMLDIHFMRRDPLPKHFSSPQHLILADREILFKPSFIDYEFAIVRDPVSRFLSAFNHARRRIGGSVTFEQFVSKLERRNAASGDFFGYRYDNHFVPAARFCTEATEIFYLEDGMDECIAQISKRIGFDLVPDRQHNVRSYAFTDSPNPVKRAVKKVLFKDSPKITDLDDRTISRVRDLYAEDYRMFPRYA